MESTNPTKDEVLASAIPIGTAKMVFTSVDDALLAMFTLGLAMGAEDKALATRIAEVNVEILSGGPDEGVEYAIFLMRVSSLVRATLGS